MKKAQIKANKEGSLRRPTEKVHGDWRRPTKKAHGEGPRRRPTKKAHEEGLKLSSSENAVC